LTSRYDVAFEHPQFWQRIDAPDGWIVTCCTTERILAILQYSHAVFNWRVTCKGLKSKKHLRVRRWDRMPSSAGVHDVIVDVHWCVTSLSDDLGRCNAAAADTCRLCAPLLQLHPAYPCHQPSRLLLALLSWSYIEWHYYTLQRLFRPWISRRVRTADVVKAPIKNLLAWRIASADKKR